MPTPLLATTLQAAVLGGVSNVLAQTLTAYQGNASLSIDWLPVFHFVLFAVISTPPNFLWQDFLESTFPAHPSPSLPPEKQGSSSSPTPPSSPPGKLSVRNTLVKFVLDQTVGAGVNTILFTSYMHAISAATAHASPLMSLGGAVSCWAGGEAVNFAAVDVVAVWQAVRAEFWGLMTAGWSFWPAVAIVNYTLVKTVQGRNLVGALAGIGWGVYMSLVVAK